MRRRSGTDPQIIARLHGRRDRDDLDRGAETARGLLPDKGVGGTRHNAPHNLLSYTTIALAAVSIASAIFVIADLDRPFTGNFTVSSQPLRDALMHLSEGISGGD